MSTLGRFRDSEDESISVKSDKFKEKQLKLDDPSYDKIMIATQKFVMWVYDDFYAGFDDPKEPDSNGLKTQEMLDEWEKYRFLRGTATGGVVKIEPYD